MSTPDRKKPQPQSRLETDQLDPEDIAAGHELSDVNPRRIVRLAIMLTIFAGLVLVIVTALQTLVTGHLGDFALPRGEVAPVPVFQPPPAPRLEIGKAQTLDELRAAEQQLLTTYGWIDQAAGTVRIPITRAMEIVAAAGLPARSAEESAQFGSQGRFPLGSSSGRIPEETTP